MRKLNDIREEINDIDEQLVKLFERRILLAKDVIDYKMAHNMEIFQSGREKEVIERNLALISHPELETYVRRFIQHNMDMSKRYQMSILRETDRPYFNIVLIGIMGSGKTTIGQILADKTGMDFVDLDDYIVDRFGMSIPDMFAISEEYFRDHEAICIKEVAARKGLIISTGGGVIKRWENIEALKENGVIFYLDRPIENIIEDVDTSTRPLLNEGADKLYALYDERYKSYLEASDIRVINDKSLMDIANGIIETYTHYKNMTL